LIDIDLDFGMVFLCSSSFESIACSIVDFPHEVSISCMQIIKKNKNKETC